jgi:nucleoside-diphosphate-sugar epimerase
MRLIVTGGTGFVGHRFVPLAVSHGHTVVGLARSDAAKAQLERLGGQSVAGDLDDAQSVKAAFKQADADALVNIASLGFGHAGVIVDAAESAGLSRAVFISTTAVATKLNVKSKAVRLAAEQRIHDSRLDWTILRPTMIYGGADDRNMARLLSSLRKLPVLPVPGGGQRLQQPVHVDDLVAAILAASSTAASVHRVYDIAGPEPLTFREVIESAGDAVGRHVLQIPVPLGASIRLLHGYERFAKRPRLKAEQLERLAEDKAFAIEDARTDLGFDPRPFDVGIRQQVPAR